MTISTESSSRSSLSKLDESGTIDGRYVLVDARNAAVVLRDEDGGERHVTDLMSAYASTNFGHRNPEIERSLAGSSDLVAPFQTEAADDVAGWLCERLGEPADRRVLFQVGGSFAVATAVALARRARPGKVLAVRGAFHGLGVDTGAFTDVQRDLALQDSGFPALLAEQVVHLEPGANPADWSEFSCFLYEPVQGANGYVPLDRGWLETVSARARAAGVITVADEIQCGFFRHGYFSISTAWGLGPDIVLFSKSLTNGMFPLSAVVYREHLGRSGAGVRLAHTFQTGTLGARAAREVTRFVDRHDLKAMCAAVEGPLAELGADLMAHGTAEDVHLTGPALSFRPVDRSGAELARRAFEEGVLIFPGGARGERVRIAPPLTISHEDLVHALEAVLSATQ